MASKHTKIAAVKAVDGPSADWVRHQRPSMHSTSTAHMPARAPNSLAQVKPSSRLYSFSTRLVFLSSDFLTL